MARLLHAMGDVHPHALKARAGARIEPRSLLSAGRTKRRQSESNPLTAKSFSPTPVSRPWRPRSRPRCSPPAGAASSPSPARITGSATARSTPRTAIFSASRFSRNSASSPTSSRFPAREPPTLPPLNSSIRQVFRREKIGAILVEPVQARGGINVPPPEFLPLLRKLCDESGALLIADEIYTGFGRTGKWFACEHSGVTPDLICLGKALTGGFPLSACVGRADLMDAAWPASTRRGDSHQHLSRPSRRLRHGAGANRGNRTTETARAQRANSANFCSPNCEIQNSKCKIPSCRARPGLDGRHGTAPPRWLARNR